MSEITRRAFVRSASAVAMAGAAGSAAAAPKGDMLDAELMELIRQYDAAAAELDRAFIPFNEAELRYFELRKSAGMAGASRDALAGAAGLPEPERIKDAAEDAVIEAESAIRDYVPATWRGLVAKADCMSRWPAGLANEDDDILIRDILALGETEGARRFQ